jgi:hypothetical protein
MIAPAWTARAFTKEVLATGTPSEIKLRAGAATLEEAFIASLPQARCSGHRRLVIPPLPQTADAVPAIQAKEPHRQMELLNHPGRCRCPDRYQYSAYPG